MDPGTLVAAALGLGLSLWSSNKQASAQRDMYNQQMSALQSINAQSTAAMPEVPTALSEDPAAAQNDEAEEERQKVLRAAAANNAMVNPTSGLGLSSAPTMKKQTLGGA